MKREDAIAEFGHSFTIDTHKNKIYERLGHADKDSDYQFESLGAARLALDARVDEKHKKRIAEIEDTLRRARLTIAFAKVGMHRLSEKVLKKAADLNAEKAKLKGLLEDPENADVEAIPAEVRVPHLLQLGQPVFIVKATYLEEGLSITQTRIVERDIYSHSNKDWDYTVTYSVEDPNLRKADGRYNQFTIQYNRADAENPEIDCNVYGQSMFLTKEAAEARAREIARNVLAGLDKALKKLDGPAAPNP